MSDTSYTVFQHYGTNAQRLAFTPTPPGTGNPIYIWYETDTDNTYVYTTAWHQIASSSSGSAITALTGDVTATGPGSSAATIANDAVTLAKLANASANDKVLGSGNAGAGANYAEITLGSGLTMTGTTLSAAGSGGTVTTTGSPASGNLTKFSGASSIVNGDLAGDVTTSGTLTTTIANSAVTLAKIANAAANSKLVGSGASGSGSAYVEVTVGSGLAMTGTTLSATGGGGTPGGSDKDIQYNNASAFGGITPGVAGTVLTSNGVSSTPSFQAAGGGGSYVLLEQHTASASASLDFTTFISSTYDTYEFRFINIIPTTNGSRLQVQMGTGAGPTWDTGNNYQWGGASWNQGAGGTADGGGGVALICLSMTPYLSNVSTNGYNGRQQFSNPNSTASYKFLSGDFSYMDATPNFNHGTVGGKYANAAAVTGVRFGCGSTFGTDTIASGTIRVYGVAK